MALIHPFADGNGRLGRAVESLILYNFGFKYGTSFALWRYYYENHEEYFTLLNRTRKEEHGDQTKLVLFTLNLLQRALNSVHKSIIQMIDDLLFKDYMSFLLKERKLTSRQYAIVNFLFERPEPISTKELAEHAVVQGLYKGKASKVRLFQKDMQKITTKFSLFIKTKEGNTEIYLPNYDLIVKSG